MGKHKVSKRSAGLSTQAEPRDSWMKDLQLQTICVDPVRWTQRALPTATWFSFHPLSRPRRLH